MFFVVNPGIDIFRPTSKTWSDFETVQHATPSVPKTVYCSMCCSQVFRRILDMNIQIQVCACLIMFGVHVLNDPIREKHIPGSRVSTRSWICFLMFVALSWNKFLKGWVYDYACWNLTPWSSPSTYRGSIRFRNTILYSYLRHVNTLRNLAWPGLSKNIPSLSVFAVTNLRQLRCLLFTGFLSLLYFPILHWVSLTPFLFT